jgi:hypothetical protein
MEGSGQRDVQAFKEHGLSILLSLVTIRENREMIRFANVGLAGADRVAKGSG